MRRLFASWLHYLSRAGALWAAALTLALHSGLALWIELPGVFDKYPSAARGLLSGELSPERWLDFSPLYLQLTILCERLAGDPRTLLHHLQIGLTAVAAGLLFALLRARFGAVLATMGTVAFAIDRRVLVYERTLEPEALQLFLVLAFLVATGRPGRLAPWVAGLAAGLSMAVRPTLLPLVLLAPLARRWTADHRPEWAARSLALLLPPALVWCVLAVAAMRVTGDPLTPVMNPGTVFFEGNNALSAGTSAIYPPTVLYLGRHVGAVPDSAHAHYRLVARASSGRRLSLREVNGYWSGKAVALLSAEPSHALRLASRKLTRAFHEFRWHDIPTAWRYDASLPIPPVPLALLAPLALVGLLIEARRWRGSILLHGLFFLQLAMMLVFYVSPRHRLLFLVPLIFFALVAVEAVRRATVARRLLLLVGVTLLAVSLFIPDDLAQHEAATRSGHLQTDRRLHELREKTRDAPLAAHRRLALEAIGASPWWLERMRPAFFPQEERTLEEQLLEVMAEGTSHTAEQRFDRGVVALEAGRLETAEGLLQPLIADRWRAYRGAAQPDDPRFYLARVRALQGRHQEAVELLREALQQAPGEPYLLADLVVLTGEKPYQLQLDTYWSSLDARYLLGRALLFHGRAAEAVEPLAVGTRSLPKLREAHLYLAAALAAMGHDEAAVIEYLRAIEYRLEPIVLSGYFVPLFRRWAERRSGHPPSRLLAARVLRQHGRPREALSLLADFELEGRLGAEAAAERRRSERDLTAAGSAYGEPSADAAAPPGEPRQRNGDDEAQGPESSLGPDQDAPL